MLPRELETISPASAVVIVYITAFGVLYFLFKCWFSIRLKQICRNRVNVIFVPLGVIFHRGRRCLYNGTFFSRDNNVNCGTSCYECNEEVSFDHPLNIASWKDTELTALELYQRKALYKYLLLIIWRLKTSNIVTTWKL